VLDQIEGSQAIARAVARCRPQVVCAYPITPQTHIVESLGVQVAQGSLAPCAFINVESEFAAMSVAIGASATGSRAYTATASQGLLYMTEAVYNAAGLGLPLVMTVANRAIGAPINIWNDHSDAMALRDAGWVQLYAADNQEAVDLHIQAFRLAEQLSVPVMVCVDGFTLTHAFERIDVPEQDPVDEFLPPFTPRQQLDPLAPLTIGAMVGPEAFTEVRYLAHLRLRRALEVIPEIAAEFGRTFGRVRGGLVQPYRLEGAETVVVVQGSVAGTLYEVIDDLRADGVAVGALAITTFRPFPLQAIQAALGEARRVVVIDRALAAGSGGFLAPDVRAALAAGVSCATVIAGLGGRPVTQASLRQCLMDAVAGRLDDLTFLDLKFDSIEPELAVVAAPAGVRAHNQGDEAWAPRQ
jgi:pyruvate ferredoxin oxidoreductase alpha subunit